MAGKKMTLNEKQIIRAVMKTTGTMQKTVAEEVGITANALKNQLLRVDSTMTLTSVYALLNAMGFELIARDASGKYGGVEYVLGENREPIETEQYIPQSEKDLIEGLKRENAIDMMKKMEGGSLK